MSSRLKAFAKWLWLIIVIGGVAFYIFRNRETLLTQLNAIAIPDLIASFVLLLMGKLLLVEQVQRAVYAVDGRMSYTRAFYINAVSQLAKYLPGGVWHFVGQAGLYRSSQLTVGQTARAMTLENIWMIIGASIGGLIAYAFYSVDLLPAIGLAWGLMGVWAGLLWLIARRYGTSFHIPRLMMTQFSMWLLLALCQWIIIPDKSTVLLAIGAFNLSWVIGFVSIFAPGGIGVREVVFAGIMAAAINPSDALIYGGVNRLLWIITEIILGVFVAQWLNAKHHEEWSQGAVESTA